MDLAQLPLISADSHVQEPPGLWLDDMPEDVVGALPPEMLPHTESESEFGQRIGARQVDRELTADEIEGERWRREVESRGTRTPAARFEVMREEGIVGECIYPSKALYLWNMTDPEAGELCCQRYNDWILDALESRSPRFRCAAPIPTWRVPQAIAEVQRAAERGLGALMLPLVGTPEYNHRGWEPLWSAIEETGLPIVMHQGTGHDMLFYRGRGAAVANLLATQSMASRTTGLLTMSGVLANYPGLHFVFVETNASWIAWAMNTLDHYCEAFKQNVGWVRPVLPELPSFYVKRQIHGTFQNDPVAIATLELTGTGPLLWGSDYPHTEGTYPNSREVVQSLCGGLAERDATDVVAGTAARLFSFAPEVLSTPA